MHSENNSNRLLAPTLNWVVLNDKQGIAMWNSEGKEHPWQKRLQSKGLH